MQLSWNRSPRVGDDAEFQSMRPLLDWLDYNGFAVIGKPAKDFDDGEGRRKVKRNIGVDLVVDVLDIAKQVHRILLFSGDGDFRVLIHAA